MHYSDVSRTSWFAPFVCTATKEGLIQGYADKTFLPSNTLNIAEASKILVQAFHLGDATDLEIWYRPSIESLVSVHAIPTDVQATGQALTRGDMAEMLWRLKEGVREKETVKAADLIAAKCDWFTSDQIPHVDIQEVRRTWLSWINEARKANALSPYMQDKELNRTATLWSLHALQNGNISHKRIAQAAYYDYNMIKDWFDGYDIDFSNVQSQTFTENIGWGVYSCRTDDCTQNLIQQIRTTFDFYMGEKNKADRPHYNSIMNTAFKLEGMGIATDPVSHKYYITTHYGTSITSDPDPVCP